MVHVVASGHVSWLVNRGQMLPYMVLWQSVVTCYNMRRQIPCGGTTVVNQRAGQEDNADAYLPTLGTLGQTCQVYPFAG